MPRMTLEINGAEHEIDSPSSATLLSVIREKVGLTGTKYGCGEGQCGACTVLLDGESTRSCMTPVRGAVGKQIRTVEGLAPNGDLHPVQQAFLAEEALQCGYCTPGMIMSAVALLETNSNPKRENIIEFMNGNVCRCGTYPRIVRAIERAAGKSLETGGRK